MVKRFGDKEYAATLSKKQIGTAVLFFNTDHEILIVKPDYRDEWLVPGGSSDNNESPLHCAIREVREEIGLDISDLELIGIQYAHKKEFFSDSIKFIFYGGVLTDKEISEIKLQVDELEGYQFVPPKRAIGLLSSSLQLSLQKCLDALKDGTVTYIE